MSADIVVAERPTHGEPRPYLDSDLLVLFFDDLVARPDDTVARTLSFLGVGTDGLAAAGLSSENRTTGFRSSRFQRVALEMIKAQGGIFGWVSDSKRALAALEG